MAIIGYLEDILKNGGFEPDIKRGLEYLRGAEVDIPSDARAGYTNRIELDGEALFALPQVYETRDIAEGKFEAHRRHIDLQYIVRGEERIRIASLREGVVTVPYDPEKDVAFFAFTEGTDLLLKSGMVAVFYPEDLHAPCLNVTSKTTVKKVVVKVAV